MAVLAKTRVAQGSVWEGPRLQSETEQAAETGQRKGRGLGISDGRWASMKKKAEEQRDT